MLEVQDDKMSTKLFYVALRVRESSRLAFLLEGGMGVEGAFKAGRRIKSLQTHARAKIHLRC